MKFYTTKSSERSNQNIKFYDTNLRKTPQNVHVQWYAYEFGFLMVIVLCFLVPTSFIIIIIVMRLFWIRLWTELVYYALFEFRLLCSAILFDGKFLLSLLEDGRSVLEYNILYPIGKYSHTIEWTHVWMIYISHADWISAKLSENVFLYRCEYSIFIPIWLYYNSIYELFALTRMCPAPFRMYVLMSGKHFWTWLHYISKSRTIYGCSAGNDWWNVCCNSRQQENESIEFYTQRE